MKQNLGKLLLLFTGLTLALYAKDFDYSMHIDKTDPYMKEAVLLTFDVNQTNHDIVLLFDFDLKKSDDYTFQRIDIKEIDTSHAAQIQYLYLIYPLKEGPINIEFQLTQKATTDEKVAYSYSGDRDNVKGLVTTKTSIDIPPLTLNVQKIPQDTQLVGDFTVEYKVKTLEAKAYEPLPFQVTIKGLGYPPILKKILPKDINFTKFTEAPLVNTQTNILGTQSTVIYPMAFSHNKSFILPSILIKAFNPKKKKSYTLSIPAQHFDITNIAKSQLIDPIDSPTILNADWSWLQTFLGYLITFIAGFLAAYSLKWKKRQQTKEHLPIVRKIQEAKTQKALLQILMSIDSKKLAPSIQKLEASLYGNEKTNLNTLKKEALENI